MFVFYHWQVYEQSAKLQKLPTVQTLCLCRVLLVLERHVIRYRPSNIVSRQECF